MPDFQGVDTLTLRPGDTAVPIRWVFEAATSVTSNSGSIPFGTTISTAVIKVYTDAGSTSSSVVEAGSITIEGGLIVAARVHHPDSTSVPGRRQYTANVKLTLNSGAVMSYECARLLIDGAAG